jgi:hypothetical protein
VLRSRLLKEALSSEGEANTLVAQFVQNTLDEHRGNKEVGGVVVGDPPIYQDKHQAYVNFLFNINKTTAFLDRTEAWHMLIFVDYESSRPKCLRRCNPVYNHGVHLIIMLGSKEEELEHRQPIKIHPLYKGSRTLPAR